MKIQNPETKETITVKAGMLTEDDISMIYSHVDEYDVSAWFLPIIKFDCVPIPGTEYHCNYMFHVKIDEKELFSADPVEMIEANEDLTDNSDIKDLIH